MYEELVLGAARVTLYMREANAYLNAGLQSEESEKVSSNLDQTWKALRWPDEARSGTVDDDELAYEDETWWE